MNRSFQFRINEETAGLRLDEFLASRFGGLSRMRLARLVSEGACRINDLVAQGGWRTAAGDLIEVTIEDYGPTAMSPSRSPLEIVYEDEHLIVVVKPAGMLVHPTLGVKTGTLLNALTFHFNREFYDSASVEELSAASYGCEHTLIRPGLVHRLDRATSGLMVVAKTGRALRVLSRHFHRRLVEKRYLALVRGVVKEDAGAILAPIGRDPESRPRWRVLESGKHAETRFCVKERRDSLTLVELEPVTGRTNQLRIHCAHIGHPICGDELYDRVQGTGYRGQDESRVVNEETTDEGDQAQAASVTCARLCLHAWRLAFYHPSINQWMEFESVMPDEMKSLVGDS